MRAKEILEILQGLSEEDLDKDVFIQVDDGDDKHNLHLHGILQLTESQYWHGDTGCINQTKYNEIYEYIKSECDKAEADEYMDEYLLMYPENTLFFTSNAFLIKIKDRYLNRKELVVASIKEGNVPHLKPEQE